MNERDREAMNRDDMQMPRRDDEDEVEVETTDQGAMGRQGGSAGHEGQAGWQGSSPDDLDEEEREMDRSAQETRRS